MAQVGGERKRSGAIATCPGCGRATLVVLLRRTASGTGRVVVACMPWKVGIEGDLGCSTNRVLDLTGLTLHGLFEPLPRSTKS